MSDLDEISRLVLNPTETRKVEVKNWIDPQTQEGTAKIAKGTMALRNVGGGLMIIGFNNDDMSPDKNIPENIKERYSIDVIQRIVTNYASHTFDVKVEFHKRDGVEYPIIIVSSDVKTPVVAKKELKLSGTDKILIKRDAVYTRTNNSNGTPSSSEATGKDWQEMLEICFENREADIGRFIRRHIGDEYIQTLLKGICKLGHTESTAPCVAESEASYESELEPETKVPIPIVTPTKTVSSSKEILTQFLNKSIGLYQAAVKERGIELPPHGTWEVGLYINGSCPDYEANRTFLQLLSQNNPSYTGWPVWLDSSRFNKQEDHPRINTGAWESLIINVNSERLSNHIDYMRLSPEGLFYLLRALEDDVSSSNRAPKPLTALDFALAIIRTAEAIAVGIAFARAMKYDEEKTNLLFCFKWSKLQGRNLTSWADPRRDISFGGTAYEKNSEHFIEVPLNTPLSAISIFVRKVVNHLFSLFEGFEISEQVVEDLTTRLLERRL